jgi:hypothetical protein
MLILSLMLRAQLCREMHFGFLRKFLLVKVLKKKGLGTAGVEVLFVTKETIVCILYFNIVQHFRVPQL